MWYALVWFWFWFHDARSANLVARSRLPLNVWRNGLYCLCAKVREAKAESEAAGAATRKDIEKLRGLHARRVKRLETLLREEGERLANARREIGEARQGKAEAPLCVHVCLCVC